MVHTARPSHWRRGAACSHTLPTAFLAGNIYVSDSARHRVAVFSPIGAFVRAFGSGPGGGFGELDDPRGIAVRDGRAASGRCCHVYVADMCNHRVQARVARAHSGECPSPSLSASATQVFSSDGAPRFVIGRHGDGACQFKYPCGVAFARGLLLVSEYVGGRVNVLTPHGTFLQARARQCVCLRARRGCEVCACLLLPWLLSTWHVHSRWSFLPAGATSLP